MRPIKSIIESNREDIKTAREFCDDLYDKQFAPYFKDTHDLFVRFQTDSKPITNDELSSILTICPLNMINVSSNLSDLRRQMELFKLKNKDIKNNLSGNESLQDLDDSSLIIENSLMICLFDSVIKRVEGEISYTRELIMSAKKLWDSRMKENEPSPISEVDDKLPDYTYPTSAKSNKDNRSKYIMG